MGYLLSKFQITFLVIYGTQPSEKAESDVTNHLIEQKLVACANIFSIKSTSWWQGAVAREDEFVSIVKTRNDLWGKVCEEVERVHPYEVPCIVKWEAEANTAYEKWIEESTV